MRGVVRGAVPGGVASGPGGGARVGRVGLGGTGGLERADAHPAGRRAACRSCPRRPGCSRRHHVGGCGARRHQPRGLREAGHGARVAPREGDGPISVRVLNDSNSARRGTRVGPVRHISRLVGWARATTRGGWTSPPTGDGRRPSRPGRVPGWSSHRRCERASRLRRHRTCRESGPRRDLARRAWRSSNSPGGPACPLWGPVDCSQDRVSLRGEPEGIDVQVDAVPLIAIARRVGGAMSGAVMTSGERVTRGEQGRATARHRRPDCRVRWRWSKPHRPGGHSLATSAFGDSTGHRPRSARQKSIGPHVQVDIANHRTWTGHTLCRGVCHDSVAAHPQHRSET